MPPINVPVKEPMPRSTPVRAYAADRFSSVVTSIRAGTLLTLNIDHPVTVMSCVSGGHRSRTAAGRRAVTGSRSIPPTVRHPPASIVARVPNRWPSAPLGTPIIMKVRAPAA
jgi:hypothetical protein